MAKTNEKETTVGERGWVGWVSKIHFKQSLCVDSDTSQFVLSRQAEYNRTTRSVRDGVARATPRTELKKILIWIN